jgi:hypothetical protein
MVVPAGGAGRADVVLPSAAQVWPYPLPPAVLSLVAPAAAAAVAAGAPPPDTPAMLLTAVTNAPPETRLQLFSHLATVALWGWSADWLAPALPQAAAAAPPAAAGGAAAAAGPGAGVLVRSPWVRPDWEASSATVSRDVIVLTLQHLLAFTSHYTAARLAALAAPAADAAAAEDGMRTAPGAATLPTLHELAVLAAVTVLVRADCPHGTAAYPALPRPRMRAVNAATWFTSLLCDLQGLADRCWLVPAAAPGAEGAPPEPQLVAASTLPAPVSAEAELVASMAAAVELVRGRGESHAAANWATLKTFATRGFVGHPPAPVDAGNSVPGVVLHDCFDGRLYHALAGSLDRGGWLPPPAAAPAAGEGAQGGAAAAPAGIAALLELEQLLPEAAHSALNAAGQGVWARLAELWQAVLAPFEPAALAAGLAAAAADVDV